MDEWIILGVNLLAGNASQFDSAVWLLAFNPAIKGLPIPIIFLFLWFRDGGDVVERRLSLLATVLVSVAAIVLGRALALALPFRERPLRSGLELTLPDGVNDHTLQGWSAMPSDHAVLFAALAASFWMINRRAGLLMAVHALLVVAFARVYLALHWPSDILVGALVGILAAVLLMAPSRAFLKRLGILGIGERNPEWMYPVLFVALFQIATMFESARQIADALFGAMMS